MNADDVRDRSALAPYVVLCLVNVLNIYDRQALGAIVEPLRREFHLSDTQIGAVPTLFTVVYALAGLPLGRLADTWSRKRLLALGVAVWAGLTGLGALAWSYAALLFTRVGVGIGEAVCAPAAISWIGDLVAPSRRARAMAGFMMAVPIGIMLSFSITGAVAQAYGWRIALAVAAAPAVLLVPLLLVLPEKREEAAGGSKARSNPRALLHIRALWWIAVSGVLVNFILYAFSTFIAAFLTRYHGLSIAQAGLWAGVGSGVAGMGGALAAGFYGDSTDRLRLAAVATAISTAPAALGLAAPPGNAVAAVMLLMFAYGLLQMYYALVYAAIQDIVPPRLRGTAMAAYYLVMYLCGGALGPIAAGRLSDFFARRVSPAVSAEAARAIGLQHAMFVIPILSIALAAVLWAAARSTPAVPPGSAAHPSR